MALSDEVIARFSATRVAAWTNPDNSAATTPDTTRLALACADAAAELEVVCGVEYDGTDSRHVQAAVWGVRAYLLLHMDQQAGPKALEDYRSRLKSLAKVTGRDRVLPGTNSNLQPTAVPRNPGSIARPDFDDSVFDGGLVTPPHAGGSPDWGNEDEDV